MKLSLSTLALVILGFQATNALPSQSLGKRAARSSPPSGCITAGNGGTYPKIQDALNSLGAGSSSTKACIFVYPGTYSNTDGIQVTYKGNLTLYGSTPNIGSQGSNTVTFTRNMGSYDAGSLDASATFNIRSRFIKVYNINFKNLYTAGQAVAVAANGDNQGYYACGFYGVQDTLYAKDGRQYYSNCYMEGRVDYIFGNAAAWFGECTIASVGGGAITAMSRTLASEKTWYVFDHSRVIAAPNASGAVGKVFLGRPWRVLARVIYQNSELTNVVHPEGWTTMAAGATPEYREFANTGAGAGTGSRKYLTTPTTAGVSKNTLFGNDWKTWVDTTW